MKLKSLFFICLIFPFVLTSCNKSKDAPAAASSPKAILKINVDYEKQPGHGSNQWAVWIENANEELVKTIYVTAFTADGGYIPRPACMPIWVSKAEPSNLSGEIIDSFSGATPTSGLQTYVWDLTDNEGNPVEKGTYIFIVEATLFGDSEAIFKAPITIGDKETSVTAEPLFTSEDDKNKEMIKSVSAEYLFID